MTKNGCRIGGEQSGHIIFSKYASTGDGILTTHSSTCAYEHKGKYKKAQAQDLQREH